MLYEGLTLSQALAEGKVIDVSEEAAVCGFQAPDIKFVGLTRAVYDKCVLWDEEDTLKQKYTGRPEQIDPTIRLRMILFTLARKMFVYSHKKKEFTKMREIPEHDIIRSEEAISIIYELEVVPRDGKSSGLKLMEFKAEMHDGSSKDKIVMLITFINDTSFKGTLNNVVNLFSKIRTC